MTKRPTGRWYFVITILSFGWLTFVPFTHAWTRLRRPALQRYAVAYGLAAVASLVLVGMAPADKQGNPVGTVGHVLSSLAVGMALVTMVVGCVQLASLRSQVYGTEVTPTGPVAAPGDPLVASRLAARQRREEARALANGDPVLARELGIGRPDLPHQYDDGGLVDLNSAPAQAITAACFIEPEVGERIVRVRTELGSFSSLDEVFAYAPVSDGTAAQIKDYSVIIPR